MLSLTLADFARVYPDGTFTLVRGGLGLISLPTLPRFVELYVLGEIAAGALDPGEYDVEFGATGHGTTREIERGTVLIGHPLLPTRFAFYTLFSVEMPGAYHMQLRVANLTGTAPLVVRNLEAST